jgi:hypothetical protein
MSDGKVATVSESRRFGEEGLAQAIERLRVAARWTAFDFALFECLSWIYALEQLHEHAPRYADSSGPRKSVFKAECQKTLEGQKLMALQWARTFAGHDLLRVGVLHVGRSAIPGFAQPGWARPGAGLEPPHWVAESALTSLSEYKTASNRAGRAFYKAHVQNQPLLGPLEEVQAYLVALPSI